ncbi:hypothetical protein VTO73DRAFT_4113 [Trametes versicolor]
MASRYEDYMTAPVALRRCYQCGNPEDEQLKLRKCAGCASVLYCSKECQKRNWMYHKPTCRIDGQHGPMFIEHNSQAKMFGFRDVDEFLAALRDFVAAHEWTFQSYVKAFVALGGGAEHMNTPPKVLLIMLTCLCARGSSLDPARTFGFARAEWQTVEEYKRTPDGASDWQNSARLRELSQEQRDDPRFAGALPVMFVVENVTVTVRYGIIWTQYHPRPGLLDGLWTREDIRKTVLRDVLVLCTSSIRLGLALRCARGQDSLAALPGRFVRDANRRWKWEPLLTDWDQYLEGPRGIEEVDTLLGNSFELGLLERITPAAPTRKLCCRSASRANSIAHALRGY